MCDGFSEAFLAAAGSASASSGLAAAVLPATAEASLAAGAGLGEASTLASIGAYAGAGLASTTGGMLALGSAGLSGISAGMQASAQQQAAQYQAQMDRNNAQVALQQRSAALQSGQLQSMQAEQQAAQVLGGQKASLAANGVDLGSGSAVDLLATTKFLNAQDVNSLQSNAARQAWGYGVDASNELAASGLASWQAKNTSPGLMGGMAGASSLLGSASMYAMGNKANLFKSFVG